jgi:hypothetical protein
MSAQELLGRLVDELPAPERVEPFAFLEDERLPLTVTLVEPAAFALACVQASWGPPRASQLIESAPHAARSREHRDRAACARPR